MIDKANNENPFAVNANVAAASTPAGKNKPAMDIEPAWKSEFRQTLEEINKVGFSAYASEIHEKKVQEMRAKILSSMGLTEQDLQNMSPDQRQQVEKMVTMEMQSRMAAEKALKNDTASDANAADNFASQIRATPNGFGAMVLAMQEIDSNPSPEDQTR